MNMIKFPITPMVKASLSEMSSSFLFSQIFASCELGDEFLYVPEQNFTDKEGLEIAIAEGLAFRT